MPRRKFTFKRRSGGRRRSFGPRIRAAKEPGRYETTDFFIQSFLTVPSGSEAETMRAFPLAAIANALNQDPNTGTQQVGVILGNMTRAIELGGIVMDYGLDHLGDINSELTRTQGLFTHKTGLCLDDIDTENGDVAMIPNFLNNWSPWTSGFPTAPLFTSIPTPTAVTKDQNRPMRMLWSKTEANLDVTPRQIFNDEAGVLYVPDGQAVSTRHGTLNRRLRVLVNDHQGLYLYFATRNSASFQAGAGVSDFRFWAQGQLYWKWRF